MTRGETIGPFRDEWFFLSNFFPCSVSFERVLYETVEHAFQAAKTLDVTLRRTIRNAKSPGAAKRLGRSIAVRDDWDSIKDEVMLTLLRSKFSREDLAAMLRETAPRPLIEVNDWGDTYWGVCDNVGENRLGRLLERVRSEVLNDTSVRG
jgi:ribA/ribD-fused uncharacterized protein